VKALWILIAAPLLAQPPQTAPPPVQLPQSELNFRNFKLPGRPNPFNMTNPVLANPARLNVGSKLQLIEKPPQTCAIPLLQVVPKGNFTMKVAKPPESFRPMPEAKVPAPACRDWNR
jgi:hypothetical protein